MNIERRVERLEEKEGQHIERVSGLRESLATLTSEINHVATSLKSTNTNIRNIADTLNKMKFIIYMLIVVGSLTIIPELKAAIPLILKMVG